MERDFDGPLEQDFGGNSHGARLPRRKVLHGKSFPRRSWAYVDLELKTSREIYFRGGLGQKTLFMEVLGPRTPWKTFSMEVLCRLVFLWRT